MIDLVMNLFMDLGSHTGSSLRKWQDLVINDIEHWSVACVEADGRAYSHLLGYIESEQNEFSHVTPFHAVVSESDDFAIPFFEDSTNLHIGSSTANPQKAAVWNKKWGGNVKKVSRQVFSLNSLYLKIQDLYDLIIVKMDIEGSEYEVLPAFLDIVSPVKTPFILIEFHDKKVGVSRQITESLISRYSKKNIKMVDWDALSF